MWMILLSFSVAECVIQWNTAGLNSLDHWTMRSSPACVCVLLKALSLNHIMNLRTGSVPCNHARGSVKRTLPSTLARVFLFLLKEGGSQLWTRETWTWAIPGSCFNPFSFIQRYEYASNIVMQLTYFGDNSNVNDYVMWHGQRKWVTCQQHSILIFQYKSLVHLKCYILIQTPFWLDIWLERCEQFWRSKTMQNIRICHLFEPVSHNQYSQHLTHIPLDHVTNSKFNILTI